MSPELADILEQAYDTFGSYTVSKPLDVCTACCVVPEQERLLLNPRVREIPFSTLDVWNHAAKTATPSLTEFKHFLPRMLEMVACLEFSSVSPELTLKSFNYYSQEDWSAAEREVLNTFARAHLRYCLSLYPLTNLNIPIDEILMMYWPAPIEISGLLEVWEDADSLNAMRHFAEFVYQNLEASPPPPSQNPFMDQELHRMLVKWATKDQSLVFFSERLERFILSEHEIDERIRAELSSALDCLLWADAPKS